MPSVLELTIGLDNKHNEYKHVCMVFTFSVFNRICKHFMINDTPAISVLSLSAYKVMMTSLNSQTMT